jgi:uncharacterized membrane protein required for colicin V production/uncharacterized protein YkwD
MLDFVLGIGLTALAVRGWLRGFVREVLDLVSLVLGLYIAYWLSGPLGNFLSDRFSVSPEVARVGSGILLFVLFGVAMSIGAHFLSQVMRLPGLNLINRIGGSAVAVGWGVTLILILVNVGRIIPLPDGFDEAVDESKVVEAIAGPAAIPQRMVGAIGVEGIIGPLYSIQSLFGVSRVVPQGNEVVSIPPAASDEIRQVRDEAHLVLDRINEHRTGVGQGALLLVGGLIDAAEGRAATMYETGRISRETPIGGSVATELAAAGIRLESSGEAIALASSTRASLDALLGDAEASALLESAQFDRAGVSIVQGPTGFLLIVVLGG